MLPSLASRHQTWVIQRTKGQEDCSETLHYVEEKNRSKHYRHGIGESFISWCLCFLITKMRTFEFKLALRSLTTPLIVDGSVSRQHVSSSLETWWRDNFKSLFFYWKTLLLSIHCDILLSPELLLSFRFSVGWSTCLRKILDKMASSADKETSFSNDDETRREKAAVGGKMFSKGPSPLLAKKVKAWLRCISSSILCESC